MQFSWLRNVIKELYHHNFWNFPPMNELRRTNYSHKPVWKEQAPSTKLCNSICLKQTEYNTGFSSYYSSYLTFSDWPIIHCPWLIVYVLYSWPAFLDLMLVVRTDTLNPFQQNLPQSFKSCLIIWNLFILYSIQANDTQIVSFSNGDFFHWGHSNFVQALYRLLA